MKTCPCNQAVQLPKVLQGPLEEKAYLQFPKSLEECRTDDDCKLLRHYTSCPGVLAKINAETKAKVIYESQIKLLDQKALSKMSDKSCGEMVLMQGGREEQWNYYQSDVLMDIFKQEQFFRYVFGCGIPDCYGIYLVRDKEFYLFTPVIPESARQYLGEMESNEHIKEAWGYKDVLHVTEMKKFIEKRNPSKIYLLEGKNSDSGLMTRNTPSITDLGLDAFKKRVDYTKLYALLEEARVCKTAAELKMLQVTTYISSMAHTITMLHTRPDVEELYHEAIFKSIVTVVGGARNVAYNCICGAGVSGSILHYGHAGKPNDQIVKKIDMLLHDMGGIFPCGYTSDITVSYPVSRKFTPEQRVIYDAVYNANMAVQKQAKINVDWIEMHKVAEKELALGLIEAGVLKGDADSMVEERIISYFQPHGLGHLIGLDVHDCGGHCDSARKALVDLPGLRNLRCTRKLMSNMFITIEPGIYFIEYLIENLKKHPEHSKYLVEGSTDKYISFGGVRIEDDVAITSKGCVNYTVVPRTSEEIEEFFTKCG